ncbi:MAG: YggT family protein [Clostridiales Family XIII bacterium]|jgi:YggT family protein|nr:YggT family protein [Clostridiales Family XIII bacterium]
MNILVYAIYRFCDILTFLLLVRAVMSWIVNPYNRSRYGTLHRINQMVVQITEPLVAPCRRLLSRFNTGMFDFSIIVTMFAIMIIRNLLVAILT